jgi:excisionase family DNA binding protein
MTGEPIVTVKEAAEALGLSRAGVYALLKSGALECYRLGVKEGKIVIDPAQVQEYRERCLKRFQAKAPALPRAFIVPDELGRIAAEREEKRRKREAARR